MKDKIDNKIGNIWKTLIKLILHIFIEKSHSKFPSAIQSYRGWVPATFVKLPKSWVICIVDNVY